MNQTDSEADTYKGLFIWTTEHLQAATVAVNGQWYPLNGIDGSIKTSLTATRIITDTRKVQSGDIFLAIVGEKFDGHDFVQTAIDKGAVAVIVSRLIKNMNIPQLVVDDTRLAFGHIAAYRRQQHNNVKVIAITGSSGKTTVKEMLRRIFIQSETTHANLRSSDQKPDNTTPLDPSNLQAPNATQLLSAQPLSTLVTRGNLNNDFGVPMMLLELEAQHRYAVLELGANHVGEIGYTAHIVKPDVACILNIGTAHLGEFGGRDNIAITKSEIYQALSPKGTAVVPIDDDYTEQLTLAALKYTRNLIQFGGQRLNDSESKPAKVYATEIISTALQSTFNMHFKQANNAREDVVAVTLPMAGKHNIGNALAAAACAYAVGIEPNVIAAGLSHAQSSKGRLGRQRLGQHHIIDDTYNANPNSVRAAADVLAAQQGIKILVLGDIGELGDAAKEEHTKLGHAIADKSIDTLLCVGQFATDTVAGALEHGMIQAYAFSSKSELLQKLETILQQQTRQNHVCTMLFKGSRSATIETLIEDLVTKTGNEHY